MLANNYPPLQGIIASKNKFIAKAKRRADVELRSALDAAGQVYVFGGGTFNQFSGFVKTDISTKSYQLDGFDKMTDLWFKRVRPGETDMNKKGKDGAPNPDDVMPVDDGQSLGGVEDPRVEAATSAFHGINAAINTVALWGRRTKEVAISDNVMFALTDLGEIFAWGGNDHWWHEVEPDSHWQTHWRGDTTARSKMLLMTQAKQAPEEEEPDQQDSPNDIEADKLKLVVQYYGHWRPPPGAEDRLTYIKGDLMPLVKFEEVQVSAPCAWWKAIASGSQTAPSCSSCDPLVPFLNSYPVCALLTHPAPPQLSLEVRGKPCSGMTKNEMVDILHKDMVLEKRVLGERAHRKIRELELEIIDLTKRKRTTMAKKIKLEANDMWRPLKEIQAEEMAQDYAKSTVERQAKYSKLEEGYETWFSHINRSRENAIPVFTPRGNSYQVSPYTEQRGRRLEQSAAPYVSR